MSALAVYFEEQGIATTTIGLVRLHLEKVQPPRGLWVPFEMGRPLGPPNNAAFQMRVLKSALNLLESAAGPVVLTDFPDDEPDSDADPDWQPPFSAQSSMPDEIARLQDLHETMRVNTGRTTVGISRLSIAQAADYLLRFNSDNPLPSPHQDMSALALMRFATDDIKAFYLEAAGVSGGHPSSRQLADWFWNRTQAGQLIRDLRAAALASGDSKRELVGNSLVPRAWL